MITASKVFLIIFSSGGTLSSELNKNLMEENPVACGINHGFTLANASRVCRFQEV